MGEIPPLSYLSGVEQVADQVCLQPLQPITQIVSKEVTAASGMDVEFQNETPAVINYIFEVVYPEQLDLKVRKNMYGSCGHCS